MSEPSAAGAARGLGGSLRRFGESVLGLFETRVEILSLEWAEERRTLTRLLLIVFAIVACLQMAIVMGLVFLMLAIGQEYRVLVLGIATLALLLVVAGGTLYLRSWLKRRSPMFSATIAEIRKDRDWIRGRS